jgi:hypothetical protein
MCYHIYMYKCQDCQREFEKKQSYCSHRGHCKLHQRGLRRWDITPEKDKKALRESTYNHSPMPLCLACGKPVKNRVNKYCNWECSLDRPRGGVPRSEATKKKIGIALRERAGEKACPKLKSCLECAKEFVPALKIRKYCCKKCADVANARNAKGKKHKGGGGYRDGSGRSKSGWYKGIHCDSTYELIFLVYHLERQSEVRRSTISLEYEFEGKKHRYHPDFDISGTLYEIKGFWTPRAQAKHEQHPEVVVVGKAEIMKMQADSSLAGKSWNQLVEVYDDSNVEFGTCAACSRRFCKPVKTAKYCCKKCREDVQFKRL